MKNELIGKNGNGVPAEIFSRPQFGGRITGGSGSPLYCFVGDGTISIEPGIEHSPYYFYAAVSQGIIGFAIFTKILRDGKIERHPDLFAAQLVGKTLEYFREQHGHEIHTIRDVWKRPSREDILSDNYRSFAAAAGNLHTAPIPVLLEAIKQTPSYRIYQPLGYSYIELPHVKWEDHVPQLVTVDFTPE